MKQLVFEAPNKHKIVEVDDPQIKSPDDVIIDVKGVGLCGTDLHIYRGHRKVEFPHVSGHECVGYVSQVGSAVTSVKPGDYVTMEPNFMCLSCTTCLSGHKNLCKSKSVVGLTIPGCLAEKTWAPADYVWKLPSHMSIEEAALIETSTVALSGVKKAQIGVGEKVLILGVGPIGIMATQLARLNGGHVHVAEKYQERLNMAEEMGAVKCYNAEKELPPQEYFDVVIDAAGVPPTLRSTTDHVRSGGRIVMIGTPSERVDMDIVAIIRRELKVLGSVACVTEFPEIIDLISSGDLRVKEVATHTFSLEDTAKGFDLMEEGKALKPVILID